MTLSQSFASHHSSAFTCQQSHEPHEVIHLGFGQAHTHFQRHGPAHTDFERSSSRPATEHSRLRPATSRGPFPGVFPPAPPIVSQRLSLAALQPWQPRRGLSRRSTPSVRRMHAPQQGLHAGPRQGADLSPPRSAHGREAPGGSSTHQGEVSRPDPCALCKRPTQHGGWEACKRRH